MGYRLGDGRTHGQRLGRILDENIELKNMTDAVLDRLFAPVRENDMGISIACILASMSMGKTELCMYLAYRAELIYGIDLKVIFTRSLERAYAELSEKKVHLIIIDDAAMYLSSMNAAKRQDVWAKWFEIRHLAEDAAQCKTGRVIVLVNFQRYASVHPNIRDMTNLWMILSPQADFEDIKKVERIVGDDGYTELKNKHEKVLSGDVSMKNQCVIRFPERDIASGVGTFHSNYMPVLDPSWKRPPMLSDLEIPVDKKLTKEEVLTMYENDKYWSQRIAAYRLAEEGMLQSDIAKNEKFKVAQSTISQWMKDVNGLIKESI